MGWPWKLDSDSDVLYYDFDRARIEEICGEVNGEGSDDSFNEFYVVGDADESPESLESHETLARELESLALEGAPEEVEAGSGDEV